MKNFFYYSNKVSTNLRKHITRNLNKQGIKVNEKLQEFQISNVGTKQYHNYKVLILAYYEDNDLLVQVESIIQLAYIDSVGVSHKEKIIC